MATATMTDYLPAIEKLADLNVPGVINLLISLATVGTSMFKTGAQGTSALIYLLSQHEKDADKGVEQVYAAMPQHHELINFQPKPIFGTVV